MAASSDAADFNLALTIRTPYVWVTTSLVAINSAILVAMTIAGVDPWTPSVDDLIAWGANYAPYTTGGHWWRLLASTFVHSGAPHLVVNMAVLWQIGSLVERLLGHRAFLAMYLISCLCGSVASIAWNPYVASVGASGAVFGVYGVLVAYLVRNPDSIPREVVVRRLRSAAILIGVNILFGLLVPVIDLAAHVGGLVAGFAGGLFMARPIAPEPARGSVERELMLLGVGLTVVMGVSAVLPRAFDLRAEMKEFHEMQTSTAATFNAALERRQTRQLSDPAFAQIIDGQVLPPWREHQRRLRALRGVPRAQTKWINKVMPYIALRERAWSTLVEALRTNDTAKASEAEALSKKAGALARSFDTGSF